MEIQIKVKGTKTMDIRDFRDFQRTLKKISDEAMNKLKQSIKRNGFNAPVFLWAGHNLILDGHHRISAVKSLIAEGYKLTDNKLPYVEIEAENEKQAAEMVLSYNSQYAEITDEGLKDFIDNFDIKIEEIDMMVNLDINLNDLMAEEKPGEDDVPEPPKEAKSKRGEIYQLGAHRLMCGDSTSEEDVKKLMGGGVADMVFTDPPYGMDLNTDWSQAKSHLHFLKSMRAKPNGNKYDKVIGDDKEFDPTFIFDYFDCKEIFLWGADYYKEFIPKAGCWFVWDKRSNDDTDINYVKQTDKMYGSCFELCWSKNKHRREIARIKWAGIFGTETEPDKDKSRVHPTQKPVGLAKWFISRFSKENDMIVDIFGGSGSTLIACEEMKRNCMMMELDPRYVDVTLRRYAKYTGQEPTREGDGKKWSEI